jgi:hypothetical protein
VAESAERLLDVTLNTEKSPSVVAIAGGATQVL